ncbi:MAG: chemotaxis response regulator protein-glutamate methylesterase [Chloroflexi bacterium]|jgi:two-component system chemotaxis response regulator CheB|nr:chemotaxis response regulator protein-glutamate methylesterase [Chloroflexota bacterium]BCY17965.1 chemotaxis response regulator protein-glutamate methylesterase [Leptolinea sp. HRD-7]
MVSPTSSTSPVKVLVVDDSAFMRFTITKHLNDYPGITVLGSAKDGREALEMIPQLKPDVVTLDVEMPNLDGLSTLREIMSRHPLPVVMLSSLTSEGTLETVRALTLGAVDFVAKPDNKANMASILEEVGNKVIRAANARVWKTTQRNTIIETVPPARISEKRVRPLRKQDKIVVIGSSTGGPRALNTVVPMLSADIPAAFMIIQHMPAGFTRSLSERLNTTSELLVKEAAPDDRLEVGKILLAPGGFHTVFDENEKVTLNQNPTVHGVRPAVDVTLLSLAKIYGNRVVAAILTGMGSDGTNAAMLVHNSGGWVISEAEETCVVYGMPRSVFEAGASNEVVPLEKVADAIRAAVER